MKSTSFRFLSATLALNIGWIAFVSHSEAQDRGTSTAVTSPDFSDVRMFIQEQMRMKSVPSVAVAVTRDDRILWEEAFGWANRESGIHATGHTSYYLGSVTKALTGTALMILTERGQVDLDKPINEYLRVPLHSPRWNPIQATVRNVATHTAGLTTYSRDCMPNDATCPSSMDDIIQRYGVLFWRPGDHFDYSNLGYGVLGELIEMASGKAYPEFVDKEIFGPLGMLDSAVAGSPTETSKAVRYNSSTGQPSPRVESTTPAASAIYSSIHDLALFGMYQLKTPLPQRPPILSDSAIDQMHNTTVPAGQKQRYGMGWWINEDVFGYQTVLAQGGTLDASSVLELLPSEHISVSVLLNTGDCCLPQDITHEILSVLLPIYRAKRATGRTDAISERTQPPSRNVPSEALLGDWTGTIGAYPAEAPLALSILPSGDVRATLGSQPPALMQNARIGRRLLTGQVSGDVGPIDRTNTPYDLGFELYLDGNILFGAATTRTRPNQAPVPQLSYWVELTRIAQ